MVTKKEDLLKRIKPGTIYPPFWDKMLVLAENCIKQGSEYWATSGLRTFQEQQRIYDQGRTIPCDQCASKGIKTICKHIISKAPPGWSPHQYGAAIDWTLDSNIDQPGLQPDWNGSHYKVLADEARKLGLTSGFYWKFMDAPHIQLPLEKFNVKWTTLINLYKNGGIPEVWKFFDTIKWF